jgi:hypothetical protein
MKLLQRRHFLKRAQNAACQCGPQPLSVSPCVSAATLRRGHKLIRACSGRKLQRYGGAGLYVCRNGFRARGWVSYVSRRLQKAGFVAGSANIRTVTVQQCLAWETHSHPCFERVCTPKVRVYYFVCLCLFYFAFPFISLYYYPLCCNAGAWLPIPSPTANLRFLFREANEHRLDCFFGKARLHPCLSIATRALVYEVTVTLTSYRAGGRERRGKARGANGIGRARDTSNDGKQTGGNLSSAVTVLSSSVLVSTDLHSLPSLLAHLPFAFFTLPSGALED